jgi:hypothetical protein
VELAEGVTKVPRKNEREESIRATPLGRMSTCGAERLNRSRGASGTWALTLENKKPGLGLGLAEALGLAMVLGLAHSPGEIFKPVDRYIHGNDVLHYGINSVPKATRLISRSKCANG